MDQPKIERLLRLMKMLSSNVNYTIGELAKKLGMSPRTIYRYIDTFKNAGFTVESQYALCGLNRFDAFLADYMVLDEAFFGRVFCWDLTPQGRPFWKNIDDLWMKYCLGREGVG